MCPVSKSTADTSTALVRSSTASARRSASVSAGCAGQSDDLEPGLVEPRELAAQGVELAVGAHEPRAPAQVQGREQADDELVGVDAEGDLAARVAEQRPEAGAHLVGLGECAPPLLVHVARGVLEGLDVALERDVRPRLVRVPGQQQPLGDAEARVVAGQRVHSAAAHGPQVGEGGVEERRAQVRGARRAAGAAPCRRWSARPS